MSSEPRDPSRYEILPFGAGEKQVLELSEPLTITVTCSPRHGLDHSVEVVKRLSAHGHRAVLHLAARMVSDEDHLDRVLSQLAAAGVDDVFLIGGDAPHAHGPYDSALGLLPVIHDHSPLAVLNFQRSLSPPILPRESMPLPPKSQRFPWPSTHVEALSRPPGKFPADGVPSVPYIPLLPGALTEDGITLLPPIHAHSAVEGLNSQRSFNSPETPALSNPEPPNSHKFPLLSVHAAAELRPPGMFPAAGVPTVPYTPGWPHTGALLVQEGSALLPPIHAHWLVDVLYSHRSFRSPNAPLPSMPDPPNSQKLPLLSVHVDAP